MCRHRGHRHRSRRRRGRRMPGRGRSVGRAHRARRPPHRRTVPGTRRRAVPARADGRL